MSTVAVRVRAGVADARGAVRDAVLETAEGRILLRPDDPGAALPRLTGTVTGRFADGHVHLALVDPAPLAGSVIGTVVDLGADPGAVADLARTGITGAGAGVRVRYAGAFLTPPGGYPSDREWAPDGSVREVTGPEAAAAAVAEMAAAGASLIKVADNAAAGPVLDDDTFRAVVAAAASHGMPVVAHAEGRGEAVRATRLGARMLAHAPFDEVLADDDVRLLAAHVTCLSTLDIHGWGARGERYEIAVENVRRLHAAGGRIRYGTDLGNGPLPVGLNARELDALAEAGLEDEALLRALEPDPATGLVRIPPRDDGRLGLRASHPLTVTDLQEWT